MHLAGLDYAANHSLPIGGPPQHAIVSPERNLEVTSAAAAHSSCSLVTFERTPCSAISAAAKPSFLPAAACHHAVAIGPTLALLTAGPGAFPASPATVCGTSNAVDRSIARSTRTIAAAGADLPEIGCGHDESPFIICATFRATGPAANREGRIDRLALKPARAWARTSSS